MPTAPKETISGGNAWYKCSPEMVLGEAPIYRSSDSTLHWVDCLKEPAELHILRVDPETGDALGRARVLVLSESVTVALFRKGIPGSYICAYYAGVAFLDEASENLEIIKEIIPKEEREERRFNDGGVDAKGRFWLAEIDKKAMAYGAGKLPKEYGEPRGRLWRFDPDGSLHEMDRGIVCGNGVAWSLDNKTMYFNDSVGMATYAYNFDLQTGSISNKRTFVDLREDWVEPDGMVVDASGNLWIAVHGSNCVMVYNPQGEHLKDVVFSAKNVTCPTWGGKNNDILYVTAAPDKSVDAKSDDEGGHVFRWKALGGVRGKPKNEFGG